MNPVTTLALLALTALLSPFLMTALAIVTLKLTEKDQV